MSHAKMDGRHFEVLNLSVIESARSLGCLVASQASQPRAVTGGRSFARDTLFRAPVNAEDPSSLPVSATPTTFGG